MKPFTINRKSWHYKLNANFAQSENSWGMHRWEHDHSSFCSYWRATTIRLFFASFLVIGVLGLLVMMCSAIYYEPIKSGIVAGSVIGLFTVSLGIVYVIHAVSEYQRSAPESQSLVAQRYRAYKSKICPVVDFHN